DVARAVTHAGLAVAGHLRGHQRARRSEAEAAGAGGAAARLALGVLPGAIGGREALHAGAARAEAGRADISARPGVGGRVDGRLAAVETIVVAVRGPGRARDGVADVEARPLGDHLALAGEEGGALVRAGRLDQEAVVREATLHPARDQRHDAEARR